jgi:phospholipase C
LANAIEHIFVLMLENRSFDHMLGFSGLTGIDAASGVPTEIVGLTRFSLLQLANSLGVKTLSGMVQKKGLPWPPPAPISVRNLFTSNQYNGQTFRAGTPAEYAMTVDPNHEFPDVLTQLFIRQEARIPPPPTAAS